MSRSKQALNPWSKTIRHLGILWGTLIGWLFSWIPVSESDIGDDTEAGIIASAVGAIIGLLYAAGSAVYTFITGPEEDSSPPESLNNPWNARIKAGAVFGEGIGRVVFSILPIPIAEKPLMLLGGAVGGVIGGIIALIIPRWQPSTHAENPEANPASERIRSGVMFGSAIGIVFGVFFLGFLTPFGIPICMVFGAGLGAALGGLFAYIFHENEQPCYSVAEQAWKIPSNPWAKRIRAGIQWGACLGILLGVLLPGLGIGLSLSLSVVVGGAIFGIAGGLISLVIEPLVVKITADMAGKEYNTANPWGPRCRFGVALGTSIGMLIGCCILPGPVGALAGGAIGGLLGGLVAVVGEPLYLACRGFYAASPEVKKQIESEELSCVSGNQYSERCRTGVLVGMAICALIGFFAFPPLGMYFGSAIGGILGAGIAFCIRSPEDLKSLDSEKEDTQLPQSEYVGLDDGGDGTENTFKNHFSYSQKNDNWEQPQTKTLYTPSNT